MSTKYTSSKYILGIQIKTLYTTCLLCKLFAKKEGFQSLSSETLVIPVSPVGLEPTTH